MAGMDDSDDHDHSIALAAMSGLAKYVRDYIAKVGRNVYYQCCTEHSFVLCVCLYK